MKIESNKSYHPYHQILKSTSIIGGSSVISVGFRVLASKIIALIVGTSGVGMIGLFNAATGLAGMVAGMGLANSSGVRYIAEAVSSGDENKIAKTTLILRRVSLILGLAGSLAFFVLRSSISILTFGNDAFAGALGLLSLTVFLAVVSGMQMAFLRGMRRVGDMARVNVLGIAIGACVGLPMLYLFGQAGVVPYLLIIAGVPLIVSWWYLHKVKIAGVAISWSETYKAARGMIGLGMAFMLSGLTALAATYLVKTLVAHRIGLEGSGLFEASSTVANMYVGFILGAMGADFFPHLSAISHDNKKSSELMNAQVEIGLLVAAPGILAMIVLGPFLLQILYSSAFMPAFEILRWQVLGTFLRVISWPMGYIILAKGKGNWFFWSELFANSIYVGFAILGLKLFNLVGIGMAFFAMYVFHTVLMFVLARLLADFRLAKRTVSLMVFFSPVLLMAFGISLWLPSLFIINLLFVLGVGAFSMKSLYHLVGPAVMQTYIQRIRVKLGF